MRHEDYVAARTARDPRFADERSIATAELKLSAMVYQRRQALDLSLETLSERTGISTDRLAAIEEGESTTLYETLWLCHALRFSVCVDEKFSLTATPAVLVNYKTAGFLLSPSVSTSGHSAEATTAPQTVHTVNQYPMPRVLNATAS